MNRRKRRMVQLELPAKGRGGRRPGAGRKRSKHSGVSHLRRPSFKKLPAHITLKMRDDVGDLRTDKRFRRIQRAFLFACDRFGMTLQQFSVQGNHIHLIVEAVDRKCLAKAMQGLGVRLAKGVNRVSGRQGAVFADRYHAHLLKTPTEVRNAVHYVRNNRQKHRRDAGLWTREIDPYSSASREASWYYDEDGAALIVVEARTWLGRQARAPS